MAFFTLFKTEFMACYFDDKNLRILFRVVENLFQEQTQQKLYIGHKLYSDKEIIIKNN